MKILIDTREQLSYEFTLFDVQAQEACLPAGDYSIPNFEDKVAIERKTLQDLIGCLTKGRQRFERELTRTRHYELFAVVIESSMDAVRLGRYRSSMNPHSPRLLPLKKAAEYLGLTIWGMREAVWRGDIPVVRFPGGRKMFIDTKDIEAFINRNKTIIS